MPLTTAAQMPGWGRQIQIQVQIQIAAPLYPLPPSWHSLLQMPLLRQLPPVPSPLPLLPLSLLWPLHLPSHARPPASGGPAGGALLRRPPPALDVAAAAAVPAPGPWRTKRRWQGQEVGCRQSWCSWAEGGAALLPVLPQRRPPRHAASVLTYSQATQRAGLAQCRWDGVKVCAQSGVHRGCRCARGMAGSYARPAAAARGHGAVVPSSTCRRGR